MPKETFFNINGFDNYLISDMGRVLNHISDHFKIPQINQQGIPSVLLIQDGRQHRRSVAVLVADAFLEPVPNEWAHFDTPTHINGDRIDCRASNLIWRPRWFAIKYHQERRIPKRSIYKPSVKIMDVETEEIFDQPWQPAIKWCLLECDIIESVGNGPNVWPGNHNFVMLDKHDLESIDIN